MFSRLRRLPFFKIVAIAQLALLARRHLGSLTSDERRRMAELARHPRSLTPAERRELKQLASKLEPRAFATAAAREFSGFGGRGKR